jgi:hypothetical protein
VFPTRLWSTRVHRLDCFCRENWTEEQAAQLEAPLSQTDNEPVFTLLCTHDTLLAGSAIRPKCQEVTAIAQRHRLNATLCAHFHGCEHNTHFLPVRQVLSGGGGATLQRHLGGGPDHLWWAAPELQPVNNCVVVDCADGQLTFRVFGFDTDLENETLIDQFTISGPDALRRGSRSRTRPDDNGNPPPL